jgi:hypothetical protein
VPVQPELAGGLAVCAAASLVIMYGARRLGHRESARRF